MTEHEFDLKPGTWIAQDQRGAWFWYRDKPIAIDSLRSWFLAKPVKGGRKAYRYAVRFLLFMERNPGWMHTLHQIQPGEIIYLDDDG